MCNDGNHAHNDDANKVTDSFRSRPRRLFVFIVVYVCCGLYCCCYCCVRVICGYCCSVAPAAFRTSRKAARSSAAASQARQRCVSTGVAAFRDVVRWSLLLLAPPTPSSCQPPAVRVEESPPGLWRGDVAGEEFGRDSCSSGRYSCSSWRNLSGKPGGEPVPFESSSSSRALRPVRMRELRGGSSGLPGAAQASRR